MKTGILSKVMRRSGGVDRSVEPFQLPGALFAGVRVLMFESGDHTDLLFAMPLIEEIRDRFPDAWLGLVGEENTSHLALSSGQFQELIINRPEQLRPRSKGFEQLATAISAEPWDIAILLGRRPDPVREELAFFSGARLRLGSSSSRGSTRLNCVVRSARNGTYPYRRTATWGRLFGLSLDHAPLHWPLPEDRVRQVAQLVHFNKPRKDQLLIGVDPGVGKEGTALAPDNLAFLVNHLGRHLRSKTMVLSADADVERLESFKALLSIEQLNLPRPTLQEIILQLSQCHLFISGNTDLFHYALALGVPALGIYTPRDTVRWVPDEADGFEILRCEEGGRMDLAELMAKVEPLLD